MRKRFQRGMTMIEGGICIAAVAILLASVAPRYMEMRAQNAVEAANEVAGAAASAININFAGCAVSNHVPVEQRCVPLAHCDATTRLPNFALPEGWQVRGDELPARNGATGTCSVIGPDGQMAAYVMIVAGLAASQPAR